MVLFFLEQSAQQYNGSIFAAATQNCNFELKEFRELPPLKFTYFKILVTVSKYGVELSRVIYVFYYDVDCKLFESSSFFGCRRHIENCRSRCERVKKMRIWNSNAPI